MSGSTLATTMQCCSVTEGMGIGNPTFRMHRAFHVELASFERSLTSGFAAFHRSGEKSSCLTAAGSIFLTTLFKYINIARSRSCCGALATRHIELALRPPPRRAGSLWATNYCAIRHSVSSVGRGRFIGAIFARSYGPLRFSPF